MFIFPIIVLTIVIILMIYGRKKAKNTNTETGIVSGSFDNYTDSSVTSFFSSEKMQLVQEILDEIDKPEPNCTKLKQLKQKIDSIEKQAEKAQEEVLTNSRRELLYDNNFSTSDFSSSITNQNRGAISTQNNNSFSDSAFNGLSIALYVGSLLILAGVAGLVFSGAKEFGFTLLVLMTVIFYGGGILLRKNETLKMASYVFVGTGMMIVPFIGLLLYDMTKMDPKLIWMIMSLVGTPMYIFASYIMNSKVFSYFAICGFASLSSSLASVMGLAFAWYFIFIMVMGLIMDVIKMTGISKKLGVLQGSVEQTGEFLPLATFVASLLAFGSLTVLDYVIMLGIIMLQLIVDYWQKPELWREVLLRVALGVWPMLITYLFTHEQKPMGLVLAGVTLGELLFTFFRTSSDYYREEGRKEVESAFMVVLMIAFVCAGILIGAEVTTLIWAWCSFALAIDTIIIFIAKYIFKEDVWYLGLLITGIVLPIAVINAIGISDGSIIFAICYMIEMIAMEVLFWNNKKQDGDCFILVSVAVFGIAAMISINGNMPMFLIFFEMAAVLWLRGRMSKQDLLKEIAIYCATAGVYLIFTHINSSFELDLKLGVLGIIFGHVVMAGLAVTSVLWDRKERPRFRMVIGSIILLLCVGVSAISGIDWAMYLFLLETVGVLLCGVFLKDNVLRITGATGAFLAVLWFTKDLSFVWPIVLGLGIIGTVILVSLYNGKKRPPKPIQ